MKRAPVVSKEDALSSVRDILESDVEARSGHRLAALDDEVRELWWAWIIPVQGEDYVRSGDPERLLFGLGPYLVDKFTREVIPTGTGTSLHALERARGYRAWWDFRGPKRIMDL